MGSKSNARLYADACVAEMHMQNSRCDNLIEGTATALNSDIIALMLLAVQRDNLQLSVKTALNR